MTVEEIYDRLAWIESELRARVNELERVAYVPTPLDVPDRIELLYNDDGYLYAEIFGIRIPVTLRSGTKIKPVSEDELAAILCSCTHDN